MSYREYLFLGARVTRSANDFHKRWSQEMLWQIASRVTPKSFYFLHAIWSLEYTIPLKQLSIADFAIVAKDSLFCDVTTVDLWRQANVFVDCFCTHKTAQKRSSLVNNSREYQFLTTR